MTFLISKSWYGASLWGKTLKIVRSTRNFIGQISHAAVAWPPAAPQPELAGQQLPVAGCIGINESLTIWLDTPFPSRNKAIRVLPSMLDVQLPFPLEDCCWCAVQFHRKAAKTISVLTVAARRSIVQQRLAQYQAFNINPVIIDHEGLALWWQSLREQSQPADATRVVVSLEPEQVSFVIGAGGVFLNAHSLQIPANSGNGLKPEEVFQRMRRILWAELPAKRKVEWVFCGSLARQPAIVNALHRLLSGEWPGPFTVHKSPETFLARALSARALAGARAACNLRQGELIHPSFQAECRRRLAQGFFLLLLAGILLCAFNLAWQLIGSFYFESARREISLLAGELAPGRAINYGREVEEVRQIAQKRLDDFAPVLNVFAQPLSTKLAEIINAGKAAGVVYTRLEINRNKLTIAGTTEDWNNCERLAGYLKNTGYKIDLERREAGDDNLVHFAVKGNMQP